MEQGAYRENENRTELALAKDNSQIHIAINSLLLPPVLEYSFNLS